MRPRRLDVMLVTSALLAACATPSEESMSGSISTTLGDTGWQLVQFKGGDDTVLTPDDPRKYTMHFEAAGGLSMRVDCNRGRGTWHADGAGQISLGSLALTRALCMPPSLHDQIVRQLPHIRSYVLRGGRLYLSLAADGGVYEFAPIEFAAP